MNRPLLVPLSLVVALGTACQKPVTTLGAIVSLTGSLANSSAVDAQAINLAVEEINKAGGVLGTDLDLQVMDDGSSSSTAVTQAQALATQKVPLVFGSFTSTITLAGAAVTTAAGIVQISGSATSPLVTSFDDKGGFLFRTAPSEGPMGTLAAKRARAHQPALKRAAVIYSPRAYSGQGVGDAFDAEFTHAGGTVTLKQAYVESSPDYSALIDQIFSTNPDVVVLFAAPTDGAAIVSAYLTSSFAARGVMWYFGYLLHAGTFRSAVGDARFAFPHEIIDISAHAGPRFDTFSKAFTARYQADPDTDAPQWYDAVYLAALAISANGSATADGIRQQLTKVSAGGSVVGPGDFKAAAADAKSGKDIDYDGASGSVDFDDKGDVPGTFDIFKIDPGGAGFQLVAPSVTP